MRLQRFDTSDIDAAIQRERDNNRQLRESQTLRSKAFAQGFRAAAEDPEGAAEWLEMFSEKADG